MHPRPVGWLVVLALSILAPTPRAGAEWQSLGLSGRLVHRIQAHGGFLYACTSDGLHRMPIAASDSLWSAVGFAGEEVLDLAALGPDTLLAAKSLANTPADTVSLFRSVDGGASWAPFQNGFGAGGNRQARRLVPLAGIPGAVLAVGPRIEKSNDGARSWRVVSEGVAVNALEQSPADPQLVWGGGETVIFWPFVLQSTDAGETWKQISLFAGGDNAVDAIAGHPTDPSVVYLGMEGRIMMSEDAGTTWWNMTSPNPSLYTFGLAIRPIPPIKLYSGGSSNLPDPRGVVIYQSHDGGLSWQAFSQSADAGYGVTHLLLNVDGGVEVLHVATFNGVHRYTQVPVGVSTPDRAPGTSLRCRPNPIQGTAAIEFSLPSEQRVSVFITDVRGRLVASLVDGVRGAGRHRASWDASATSQGIYFCRLEAGGRRQSLKILHLR